MADKNLWSNYTETDTLTDKDEVMVYDSVGKTNKRSLMEKFWDYIVEKMATAVISKLETENKTVIGALNYLNGKYISRGERVKSENGRVTYRIVPILPDISILCINRTGLYLISIGQSGENFIGTAQLIKLCENKNDAKIQIENSKFILFECDIYSNPIFLSIFK